MADRTQKICRISLANIPKDELFKKAEGLFYPDHKILDGDYLNVKLDTVWIINSQGNEIPGYSLVAKTDYDSQRYRIDLGVFSEHSTRRYQALLNILQNEQLTAEDITFFEGFEKEDIKRIAYISMQIYGVQRCLNREHCNFLFDSLHLPEYPKIELSEKEKKTIVMDIPSEYFEDGKEPVMARGKEKPYISTATFKYLTSQGVLQKGTLSLDECVKLTPEESGYINWLEDKSNPKPNVSFDQTIDSQNIFKKIFKKSPEKDLSLEF